MPSVNTHISFYKRTIALLLVLFSLAPCGVKESLFHTFGAEYNSPLNKTKTNASQLNTCSYWHSTTSITNGRNLSADIHLPAYFTALQHTSKATSIGKNKHYRNTTCNSPPIYILFKRMKLDLA